jgi:hypothetical protein
MIKHSIKNQGSAMAIVIVGIILVGALVGIFWPRNAIRKSSKNNVPLNVVTAPNVLPNQERETNAYYQELNNDKNTCGIKIFSPLPGQKVSFPLEVSGYVNGCGWAPFEGQIGTLQIRDANQSLSPIIILPVEGDSYTLPAYFKVKIPAISSPTSQDGVFIFMNEDASGENPLRFQLPVTF